METQRAAELVFDRAAKHIRAGTGLAVDDLSLEIPAGEICVLVGPSGSGKTTSLKMVNGLIPLTRGDIRLDGRRSTEPRPSCAATSAMSSSRSGCSRT